MSDFYKGKRVLVTGGAGFVGSNLVNQLMKEGAIVSVIDDLFTGNLENIETENYTFSMISVYDIGLLSPLFDKLDIVFHLAARNIIASTKNPIDDYKTNIGGTLKMLMAMRVFSAKRMVYTSSASVYGNPRYLPINEDDGVNLLTPYAVSKYAGEGYCMAFHDSFDVPVTVLRLSNVYGPHQSPSNPYCGVVAKFMDSATKERKISVHGSGLQTRDFTYVDDVVDALLLAGESPKAEGEVFNVATGIETSVLSLAVMVGGMYNLFGEINHVENRDIDNISRRVLNIEKIRRKLGWKPKTILQDGLWKTKAWLND